MYFRFFIIISPWKRAWSRLWKNMNPNHPRMLCAKLGWNIGPVVLEKKIFKFCQCIFAFCNYLPLEKGRALHLNKLNTYHPRMFCAKFGWNWPSGSWEEDENVKSLQKLQRRWTTDKLWSEKLNWAFGSDELIRRWIAVWPMALTFTDFPLISWQNVSCPHVVCLYQKTSQIKV